MEIVIGSVVKSKAGRDKDSFSVVVDIKGNEAFVCDGKYRKYENPKKKNIKHLSATSSVIELPKTNKQLRITLKQFRVVD